MFREFSLFLARGSRHRGVFSVFLASGQVSGSQRTVTVWNLTKARGISSGLGVIHLLGDIDGGRIFVGLLGLVLKGLPLFEVDGALPQQIIGQPLQFAEVRIGGLLPVGPVVEQALPRGEVGWLEVVAHEMGSRGVQ